MYGENNNGPITVTLPCTIPPGTSEAAEYFPFKQTRCFLLDKNDTNQRTVYLHRTHCNKLMHKDVTRNNVKSLPKIYHNYITYIAPTSKPEFQP